MLIWVTSSLLQLNVGTTPKKISLDANPVWYQDSIHFPFYQLLAGIVITIFMSTPHYFKL
jgi:hypothetical protein